MTMYRRGTVREPFQVLEDTLIGFQLPPYQHTRKRKPVATAKFYFFDVGVANALMKRGRIEPGSEPYGPALEHQVFLELKAYLDHRRLDRPLTFWRTHVGHEVDFVVGDTVGIEVKGARRVTRSDVKGLLALSEERRLERRVVVCLEPRERTTDEGVTVLPVQAFFQRLWEGTLID